MRFDKDPTGGNIIPAQKGKWYVGTDNMSKDNYELVKVLGEPYETDRFGRTGGRYKHAVESILHKVYRGSVKIMSSTLIAENFISPAYYREARPIDFHIFMSMVFGEEGRFYYEKK
jgi:hypothetical protein